MTDGPPSPKLLSVVIPVYNERDTWREVLARVQAADIAPLKLQIVLVDDCSTDGTREQLAELCAAAPAPAVKVLFHRENCGKGAAVRTGFAEADGDLVIVQDADLEYDPRDYPILLAPLVAGEADVVYGSRFLARKRKGSWANYLANRVLTELSNLMTGLRVTDMETCYKVFRRDVLRRLRTEEDRFGFEPEITAKVARLGVRVAERPISYEARTQAAGKKIGLADGVNAVWCILKYNCPIWAFGRAGRPGRCPILRALAKVFLSWWPSVHHNNRDVLPFRADFPR